MLISLIVVMAAVLTGLIFVQTSTIMRASEIEKRQFNQLVKNALLYVAAELNLYEEMEARDYARNQRLPFETETPSELNVFPRNNISGSIQMGITITEQGANSYLREEYSYKLQDTSSSAFRADSLSLADIFRFNQQRKREQYLRNMNWRNYKIFLEDRPIEERIDSTFLDRVLRNAIQERGINIEYKYAVKNSNLGQEKLVFGAADYDPGRRKEFPQRLFQSDSYGSQPNYLNIYFPKRSAYLLKATGISIIPTIILTALLIGIFAYTIMVIFRQKKLSNIKNDFINNMTHELKTPISTISLASQMLQDGSISNTPSMIDHVSKVISQESKRLSFQVEKVLQMAVFNEGRLKLKFKEFDLNPVVRNIVSNFELRVKNENGTIATKQEEGPLHVKGDEVHITNVVFNLLDNAMKYSEGDPKIQVTTEMLNEHIAISIQDSGIGIAKEHQSQIFDRFFRVPTGNVHDVKGFGLGLHYVKKIVDSHGAKITVDSALNKGTKFTILFPHLNN